MPRLPSSVSLYCIVEGTASVAVGEAQARALTELARAIAARTEPVPIPWDCCDGNFPSYWRRPEAYLEERVRRAVSVWHLVGPAAEERVVRELRADLESGRWAERNQELLDLDEIDIGGRLLIA